jgi:hypothetical protein
LTKFCGLCLPGANLEGVNCTFLTQEFIEKYLKSNQKVSFNFILKGLVKSNFC